MSVVNAYMGPEGWTFEPGHGVVPDDVNGARRLHEIYTRAVRDYTGRVTVPVLWDKQRGTIVSNESSEIIRMLNSAFAGRRCQRSRLLPAAAARARSMP